MWHNFLNCTNLLGANKSKRKFTMCGMHFKAILYKYFWCYKFIKSLKLVYFAKLCPTCRARSAAFNQGSTIKAKHIVSDFKKWALSDGWYSLPAVSICKSSSKELGGNLEIWCFSQTLFTEQFILCTAYPQYGLHFYARVKEVN
jgi:hypothetical protein